MSLTLQFMLQSKLKSDVPGVFSSFFEILF